MPDREKEKENLHWKRRRNLTTQINPVIMARTQEYISGPSITEVHMFRFLISSRSFQVTDQHLHAIVLSVVPIAPWWPAPYPTGYGRHIRLDMAAISDWIWPPIRLDMAAISDWIWPPIRLDMAAYPTGIQILHTTLRSPSHKDKFNPSRSNLTFVWGKILTLTFLGHHGKVSMRLDARNAMAAQLFRYFS